MISYLEQCSLQNSAVVNISFAKEQKQFQESESFSGSPTAKLVVEEMGGIRALHCAPPPSLSNNQSNGCGSNSGTFTGVTNT